MSVRRTDLPKALSDHFSTRAVADPVREPVSRLPSTLPEPTIPGPGTGASCETPGALLGLARGGVYHAPAVTSRAVRSYRTISPLPVPVARLAEPGVRDPVRRTGPPVWNPVRRTGPPAIGGLLSAALSLARDRLRVGSKNRSTQLFGRVGVTHHRVLSCSDFPQAGPMPACGRFAAPFNT